MFFKNQTPSKRDKQNSESLIKTHIKNLFLLSALIAGLGLIPAGRVTAQTFTILHSFTLPNNNTNSDGAIPLAGLILSGNTIYGTANDGGSSGAGTGSAGTVSKRTPMARVLQICAGYKAAATATKNHTEERRNEH
jgi:hypothetical protein